MAPYQAPLRDMQFVLHELAGLDDISKLPGFEEAAGVAGPVLQEAASFAAGVLDPINQSGDKEGCTWRDGAVTTPKGFKEAYAQFARGGWIGLAVPTEHGGQGLPSLLSGATLEMWNAANVGFANGPLLNQGAIEAIELIGSGDQKKQFIPKLVSGEWTGTMCLTEPQAGSDLAQVRTKAVPDGDRYRITGQKIFITFGEHDMAANIIHLVLARLPDAPQGTKGISMFIVPKFLIGPDGALGERNDVQCAGIEHKLGLNANPTCTLNYGEHGGAIGYLIGKPNEGLKNMFIMMNAARFSVGVQGLAIADRAYQSALRYAKERVQSRDIASRSPEPRPIIEHPDVRRMLMTMKAQLEAMRALAYVTAASLDLSAKHPDAGVRQVNRAFLELMIPVVKGWCTETAVEICSTAVQVFGGIGYVEETGIAQQYRDVRITTIYEGTTGIQALDLVGRKIAQDMGATAKTVISQMRKDAEGPIGTELAKALASLSETSDWIGMTAMGDLRAAVACSVPYLKLWGITAGGWQMARAAKIAERRIAEGGADVEFYKAKLATAKFYAAHILNQTASLAREVIDGSAEVMTLSQGQFDLRSQGGDRVNKVITLDNPPVNALSFKYSEKILKEIEAAEKDPSVTSVTITGANGFFSAGVDVNDFQKAWDPSGTTVRDIIESIERSDKVFIAAIDGIALGGALELALACDRRIATPRSKLGLPEIKLGLIPGAGGTQRLPRLIPPQEALQMMLKGEAVSAERALELGLIDDIVEAGAIGVILSGEQNASPVEGRPGAVEGKRRVSAMKVQLPATAQAFALPYIIAEAHKTVPPEESGGFAAHKLIDAVQAAFELPFARGLAREYRLFDELVASAPSLALRHLFFAERELAKIPGLPSAEPLEIKTAGVVGGGTMGTGIAITFASAGIPVTIVEPDADQIGKSRQTIFGMFMHEVKRGRMTQEEAWKRGQSIAFSDDYAAVADCDLVIEAVFENMVVKKEVFGKLDPIVKPGAILASNTSTLDIDEMAAVTKRPEQFLGLHFFAPANIMKLLEIVRGKETSAQTLATAFKLAKQLRKVAVLSANAFGFIGNRMFFEYTREAVALAEEGVPPARIDAAMKKFGMAMGPFATFDLSGIDVFWHVAQGRPDLELARTPILDRLYEQQRLGQKTGKGFYKYAEGSREAIRDEEIEQLFADLAKKAGVKQQPDVSDEEIASRIVGALIKSGEEILRDGVALRPGDIDIVWIYGYGFPPYRGGPMWYAQEELAHA